jgi:hypothetical protein
VQACRNRANKATQARQKYCCQDTLSEVLCMKI